MDGLGGIFFAFLGAKKPLFGRILFLFSRIPAFIFSAFPL
jgi:hypothetical protein